MRNIFGLFGMFSWALAATCSSMVSNIIGQGLQHRVNGADMENCKNQYRHRALLFALLLNLFPYALSFCIRAECSDWVEPCHTSHKNCIFCTGDDVFFRTVCVNAVTGTGNTKVSFLIELITIIMYCFYVWFVLEHLNLSVAMGWTSEWLYWGSMFIMAFYLFKKRESGEGKVI